MWSGHAGLWYDPAMTLDALIMFAGGFVAVLPFLGLPNSWDSMLLLIAGVAIVALGITVRRRLARPAQEEVYRDLSAAPHEPIEDLA